ncbi:MAG: M14 family zinc carboxypeptidase [Armatimonadota bacterium]
MGAVTPAKLCAIILAGYLMTAVSSDLMPRGWAQEATDSEERPNLVTNADFEEGEDAWERRTADSESRVLSITPDAARSGEKGARIENLNDTHSRWRQGSDGSIRVEPGSMVRLSGWIRTDLSSEGYAAVRIYAMTDDGEITAQPISRPVAGESDWTRSSVNLTVPDRTGYLMAYLELPAGVGTADYDDLEMVVVSPPIVREVSVDLLLLTDAPENDPTAQSLHTLYPDQIDTSSSTGEIDAEEYTRLIAFERDADETVDMEAIEAFVSGGGRAVVDLALYARARDLTLVEEQVVQDEALLRIAAEAPVTRGFTEGDTIPWHAGERDAPMRRALEGDVPGEVIAEAPDGAALLVLEQIGDGSLLATDLVGLEEPVWNQPGSFNKYLFAGNLLGESVRYGAYFQDKLTYEEFVDRMRALADGHDEVQLRDEGPADEGYRMYSLTIGDEDRPAMFVYAAAHGSEWEPAYGLLALAERLMELPDEGLFDFDRYHLVMMPIVNPWGYDNRRRQNSNGVDLNRNGDERWEEYVGRTNDEGVYAPGVYDWKGDAPFSELPTQAWKRVLDRTEPRAVLDFHGNAGGAGNNRLIFIPSTGAPGNEDLCHDAVRRFNDAIADRYVVHESKRPGVQQYEIESISWGRLRPTLTTTACRDGHGFIVEVPAGYPGTYGMVFQTDVVIETILAFFRAYE